MKLIITTVRVSKEDPGFDLVFLLFVLSVTEAKPVEYHPRLPIFGINKYSSPFFPRICFLLKNLILQLYSYLAMLRICNFVG